MMWMTFRIFFRRIMIVGKERILHNKPTIIIANHPASFLDAMVLAVFLRRPLHFYVRGDIFSHPLARWVLTRFHMIPIYSIEHGIDNLGKNQHTFDLGKRLLSKGKMLLIFPEGFSRFSKKLAPFKKGAARVALQTAFDNDADIDLQIQVVSISYSYHGFRSDLIIRVGDSMQVKDYRELYLSKPNHAIADLNKEMMALFEKNIIHIQQAQRTSFTEALQRFLFCNEINAEQHFNRSRKLCDTVSSLSDEDFEREQITLQRYESLLKNHRIQHESIVSNFSLSFIKMISLLVFAPLFCIVYPMWQIVLVIAKWIADRTVTREDFYTSVFSGVLGVLGLIMWITLICLSFLYDSSFLIMFVILSPFLYMISLKWIEEVRSLLSLFRLRQLRKNDRAAFEELKAGSRLIYKEILSLLID